ASISNAKPAVTGSAPISPLPFPMTAAAPAAAISSATFRRRSARASACVPGRSPRARPCVRGLADVRCGRHDGIPDSDLLGSLLLLFLGLLVQPGNLLVLGFRVFQPFVKCKFCKFF